MGMFKQFKDMKDMVAAAPGMVEQAQQLGAQAQQMAAAQQAAAQQQMMAAQQAMAGAAGGGVPSGPDFEPISGVSLETYAAVSKGVAAFGYDQSKLPEIAASHGVEAADWDSAAAGWAARIKSNPAVGQRFNALYRAS